MVAEMFSMESVPKYMKEFTSKIMLSTGRRTMDQLILRNDIKDMLSNYKLKPFNYDFISLDNFGMGEKGGKWAQHTVI